MLDSLKDCAKLDDSVMCGMIALGMATGCKLKELRMALIELDLKGERFFVRHPKGDGLWESPQWVSITLPEAVPYMKGDIWRREWKG